MKKIIVLLSLVLLGFRGISQSIIYGPAPATPGSLDYYEAAFQYTLSPYTVVTWYVTGGYISYSNSNPTLSPIYCMVVWDTDPATPGYISISEDLGGQFAELHTMTGVNPVPAIYPTTGQAVNYGNAPPEQLHIVFDTPPSYVTYQWEKWDPVTSNWTTLTGEINDVYTVPATFANALYRCVVDADGTIYYLESTVTVNPLYVYGITIYPATSVAFNTVPPVSSQPATGGFCYPNQIVYTWEYSVEDGPWVVIGNSASFPVTAPPITGKTAIRRRVQCGSEEISSNILLIRPAYTSADWENRNYIRENKVIKKGVISYELADNLPIGDKLQSTTYFDGQGRPVQSVEKEAGQFESGSWGDIVTHIEYDAAGRNDKTFIPYLSPTTIGKFKTNARTEQENFVRTKYAEAPGSPTYKQIMYELNPLSRPLNVKEAGTAYGGNVNYSGISTSYKYNRVEEGIRVWTIGYMSGSVPVSSETYATGKLIKTVTLDELGRKVYTYANFDEKVVLKKVQLFDVDAGLDENGHTGWLCTYYVYDDLGRLRSTITPRAVKYLETNSWTFNSNQVYQELCFWDEYDVKGRPILKHAAGDGEIHLVYDKKDRLVLSQDQNQRDRSSKQWSFFLYDNLDRPLVTGLYDNAADRNTMQTHVNNLNNTVVSINIYTGSTESVAADNPVAGNSTYCNSCSNTLINVVQYYDNYSYPGAKSFNSSFSFASTTDPNVETSVKSQRTIGFETGSKKRVIDANADDGNPNNDAFLVSTSYYDEKARNIQQLTDNVKNAVDYVTVQYNFAGKVLSTCDKHTMPGTSMTNYQVTTKYEYDKVGKLTILSRQYGALAYKKLAQYSYDEYGRVKNRKLSPDYNGGTGIENLKYDYNIRGWLNGINKDYALSGSSLSQWDHYFGAYYGYDNRENLFSNKEYNGNQTGVIWKTQGDNMPRRYDYVYDHAGRFRAANYLQKEKPTDASWNNTQMNFAVTDIQYDENNNLLQMNQKGVIPGNNSPVFIDKLLYEYKQVASGTWSNQLRRVYDQTTDLTSTNNGAFGDFKDETYGTNTDDYVFDGNGNLVRDNNKKIRVGGANGVVYNYMNRVQKVTIENKSIVEFIYSASGNKLGKKVTNTITGIAKTTWYIGNYIYEEVSSTVKLQMITHEEGRIRVYPPVSNPRVTLGGNFSLPDNNLGVFEFFIKDNLQNTRAILSEETHSEYNNCTMETAGSSYEERMFGQVDGSGNPIPGVNEVIISRRDKATFASGWSSNSSATISRLKQDEARIGPNMLMKVMAGDLLTSTTDYYYTGSVDNGGAGNIITPLLGTILGSLNNNAQAGNVKGSSGAIANNYTVTPGNLGNYLSTQNQGNSTPQAYLNIIFFDENFNFVAYDAVTGLGSYGWRVGGSGSGQQPIQATNVKVPKNGYAFVYLSNESNTPVYFDNFTVTHTRGRLVEENAYYPYGLKIKGISAKAFDKGDNKYGYQGDYAEAEEETNWDEFTLRMYDAQIGKWTSSDPYNQFSSPYVGMGANPVNNVDKTGGAIGWVGQTLLGAGIGFGIGYSIGLLNQKHNNPLATGVIGAFLGAGIGLASWAITNDVKIDKLTGQFMKGGKAMSAAFQVVANSLFNASTVILTKMMTESGRLFNKNSSDIANSALLAFGTSVIGSCLQIIDNSEGGNAIFGKRDRDEGVFALSSNVANYVGPTLYGYLDRLVYAQRHQNDLGLTDKGVRRHSLYGALDGFGASFSDQFIRGQGRSLFDNFAGNNFTAYLVATPRAAGGLIGTAFIGITSIAAVTIGDNAGTILGGAAGFGGAAATFGFYIEMLKTFYIRKR